MGRPNKRIWLILSNGVGDPVNLKTHFIAAVREHNRCVINVKVDVVLSRESAVLRDMFGEKKMTV